jgi:hypothetical protein
MKRLFISVLLCLAMTSVALAQQSDDSAPASKEDVENYMQAIHSHEMIQKMLDSMSAPMHKMIHEQYMKDKDKLPSDFEAREQKMIDDMLKDMPFDEMMQAAVPAYQKHLTKADISALTAFYLSPTGQKVLRELPAIMGEAMNSMMPIMQRYIEKITQRTQDELAAALKQSEKGPGKPLGTPSTSN